MPFADLVDNAIFAVAPVWGARRKATRRRFRFESQRATRLEELKDRLDRELIDRRMSLEDGHDRNRLRDESWLISRLSPNSELESSLQEKRDRSNDLYKHDDIAHGVTESMVNGVFGTTCRIKSRVPVIEEYADVIDKKRAAKLNRQIEWLFFRWACYGAIDGGTLLAQLRLGERCSERDGDVLMVLPDKSNAHKPIPLAVEVIEADRVETRPEDAGNPNVRLGVEVDPETNAPIGYWVRTNHPGDTVNPSVEYQYVPAYDKAGRRRAYLVFEKMWPGQLRGLPRLFASLNQLKDRQRLREVLFINQQIACCFNVFIKTVGDPEEAAEGAATEKKNGRRYEDLEPGVIHRLARDEEIEVATPNPTGLEMVGLLDQDLHGIAAAAQLPYAVVARNWSRFTYSGGRLERTDERNAYKIRQQLWRETLLHGLGILLVFEGVMTGEIDIEPFEFSRLEWLFTVGISWLISLGEWMDPKVDVQAAGLEVESNLTSLTEKCAERGKDLEEILDERAAERQMLIDRGLPVSSR